MNKNLDIRRNTNVLFVLNIVVFITMIFFRNYYGKLGYTNLIINTVLFINIVVLIVGIVFNVFFIKDPRKYDTNKVLMIIFIIFFAYLFLNTVGTISINKIVRGRYLTMANKVRNYCKTYNCDNYEVLTEDGHEIFVIKNKYFDYDKKKNDLEIRTTYNKEEVVSVVATVYSRKEMFSEALIEEKTKNYFYNFNAIIDNKKIREAFEKRFDSEVNDGNLNYKVREIYNKEKELEKLKTVITLTLRQG